MPGDITQSLNCSRRPMDFDQVGMAIRAKAEVHRTVTGGGIADTGGHVVVLGTALGHQLDARADAVAIALGSSQRNVEPVSGLLAAVHPDLGVLAKSRRHHVDAPVAIQIAKGAAAVACSRSGVQSGCFSQRNPLPCTSWIAEYGVVLIDGLAGHGDGFNVAARYK